MGKFSAWSLFLVLSLLAVKVLSEDGFDLSDAFDDTDPAVTKAPATPPPAKPEAPAGSDIDLSDFFDDAGTTIKTPPPKVAPQPTKAPAKPKPKPADGDFNLEDALDPNNDVSDKDKNKGQGDKDPGAGGRGDGAPNRGGNGGGFDDSDLEDVGKDDTYKPDKGKGGRPSGGSGQIDQTDDNSDTMVETGTIAGIVSAVAMALVGAVSSYISYQKKKFCFSIQQSLNTDMVKAENLDAVVATEPQVQQTLLEPPNAEPPSEENAV